MDVTSMIYRTLIDLIQVSMVMSIFLGFTLALKKERIIIFIAISGIIMIITQWSKSEDLYATTGIIICSFFVYIMFEKGEHNRLLCMFMIYCIVSALDVFCWYALKCINVFDGYNNEEETLAHIVATVIVVIFVTIYKKVKKIEFNTYAHKSITLLICCTLLLSMMTVTFPMLEENYEMENTSFSLFFTITMLLVLIICIFVMYFATQNDEYKIKEEINSTKIELLNNYYHDLIKNSEDIRNFRHDYKNHIRSIKYLVNKGEYDKLRQYVEDIEKSSIIQNSIIDVNNEFVSAILSDYKIKFEKDNIKMQVKGKIPEDSNVTDMDWCTIFSNCLQNSLEATRYIKNNSDKIIEVNIKKMNNKFLIEIQNPVEKIPVIKDNEMKTTKKDKTIHGRGIKNIKKCLEKYHGSLSYHINEQQKRITTSIIMVISDY